MICRIGWEPPNGALSDPDSCSALEEWEGDDADGTAGKVRRYGLCCICRLGNHRTTLCKEQRKEMTVVTGTS